MNLTWLKSFCDIVIVSNNETDFNNSDRKLFYTLVYSMSNYTQNIYFLFIMVSLHKNQS